MSYSPKPGQRYLYHCFRETNPGRNAEFIVEILDKNRAKVIWKSIFCTSSQIKLGEIRENINVNLNLFTHPKWWTLLLNQDHFQ